jgi:DNA-binding transcriptional MerR regulator
MRTVGSVSELAGVTVRTLHHYDEIGLLSPSERSDAGYRLYSLEDLMRLQEILVWRQLGFPLDEVKALLDDPAHDRRTALTRQRQLVEHELDRLGAVRRALDAALDAHANKTKLKEQDMFEGFDPTEYEDEARERWGDTDAYEQSARRTAGYGESEWRQIKAEADTIVEDFTALFAAGEPPSGERARAVAERHRQHISRWFYPCSAEMHRGLGEMYVSDDRFAHNYEQHAEGLAAYVRDAIAANTEGQATLSR